MDFTNLQFLEVDEIDDYLKESISDAHDNTPLDKSLSGLFPGEQEDDLELEIVSDGKTKRTARS